jgi:hypothetical protein
MVRGPGFGKHCTTAIAYVHTVCGRDRFLALVKSNSNVKLCDLSGW